VRVAEQEGRKSVVVTPWPAAMLIRVVFERGAADTVRELNRHVPASGVTARTDLDYGDGRRDTRFDLFRPEGATGPLPVVVWIHGGAWISGWKENVAPYLRILAGHGYAAAGLNYSLAPEHSYPTAVVQLNRALAHLDDHAAELGIDPSRIVLAGDSAGAQLASQLATAITSPDYASMIKITPAIRPAQLRGVILQCGVYDLDALAATTGIIAWGFKTSMWAYSGDRNWSETAAGKQMSTLKFVTADFPPAFISGGNADGLTPAQSVALVRRLEQLAVPVTTRFFAADHEPALGHEYQFKLDGADARETLARTLAFLESRLH
jgi:acetyl esterase/lipase